MARIRPELILFCFALPALVGCSTLSPQLSEPSGGVSDHRLPNVAGLSADAARAELTTAGLTVKIIPPRDTPASFDSDLLVISQEPEAGHDIADSGQVVLTVGIAPTLSRSAKAGGYTDREYVAAVLHEWGECLAALGIRDIPAFIPENPDGRVALDGKVSVATLTWDVGRTHAGTLESIPRPGVTLETLEKVGC